jgi:Ca2+-binding RTX toxin-like protein
LWFKRVKDNLEISLLGTADKVTIESWYKGAAYQLEAIQTQVGMVLAPAQVDVLVAAMAKVSNPNALATMPAAVTTAISSAWQLDSATRYVMGGDLDDTIGGGNGADTIDGGAGDDDLSGNGGDDFFVEDVNDDLDRIDGGAGNNTVSYERTLLVGAGISADLDGGRVDKLPADGTLPASYDTLTNVDNIIGSWGDDELSGNTRANCMDGKAGDDALSGYGGNDSLSGGDGNDYIDGGAGNDVLNGGAGADLYVFNAGDGADVVTDNDAIADTIDTIYFGSGITVDKLWFQHVGNDLQVSVIGTGDSVKVTDWYSGAAHQIEMFSVNNSNLLGSDVEKMVNAMAGLNAPGMGQLTLPATYETRLGATRAANWHAAA